MIEKYVQKNNLKGLPASKIPKISTLKFKPFELIIDGFIENGRYGVDTYISLIQYLLKNGYIFSPIRYTGKANELRTFFQHALFSVNTAILGCAYNNKFDIIAWRNKFDLMGEMKVKVNPFYRNRQSMPIEPLLSVSKIEAVLFNLIGQYQIFFRTSVLINESPYLDIRESGFEYVIPFVQGTVKVVCNDMNYIDFITLIHKNKHSLESILTPIEGGYGCELFQIKT